MNHQSKEEHEFHRHSSTERRAIEGYTGTPNDAGTLFFAVAAITMLTTMVAGFHPYYLRGEGMAGRTISPQLVTLVFVHGAAMTAWLILFLVQSLLVPARKLRIHMKLGWGGVATALVAAGSGFMLRSNRFGRFRPFRSGAWLTGSSCSSC